MTIVSSIFPSKRLLILGAALLLLCFITWLKQLLVFLPACLVI